MQVLLSVTLNFLHHPVETNKQKKPKTKKQKPPLSLLAIANTMSPQVLSLTQEICVFCHHL